MILLRLENFIPLPLTPIFLGGGHYEEFALDGKYHTKDVIY